MALTLQAPGIPTIKLDGTPNIATKEPTILSDFQKIQKYVARHKTLPPFLSSRYSALIFNLDDYRNFLLWSNILRVDWDAIPDEGGMIFFFGKDDLLWIGDASSSIKKRLRQLHTPFTVDARGRGFVGKFTTTSNASQMSTAAIKDGVTCVAWLTHTQIKNHGIRWFRDEFIKTYSPKFQSRNVNKRAAVINPSGEINA